MTELDTTTELKPNVRRYRMPDGREIVLTEEEFQQLVAHFALLDRWNREAKAG